MSSDDPAAIERRNELKKMAVTARDASSAETDEQSEGEEITGFLVSLKSDRDKRKHQLGLVKDLYENPMKLNFREQFVPSSSTPEEIVERKTELQYRIKMLKAVLEITEGELQLLSRAAPPDGEPGSGNQQGHDEHSQEGEGHSSTD